MRESVYPASNHRNPSPGNAAAFKTDANLTEVTAQANWGLQSLVYPNMAGAHIHYTRMILVRSQTFIVTTGIISYFKSD